ncbi:hypothetical protein AX14_000836 [Amanita brunnescens Koide BX004]|nr:hypothetical protein AX14_000836 [Amanita brunnescens Koide BX004]
MPRSYLKERGVKIKGRKVNDEDALEFTLFDTDSDTSQDDGTPNDHELLTCPILTREAYVAIDGKKTICQYGVLGKIIGIGSKNDVQVPDDPRLYLNTVSSTY